VRVGRDGSVSIWTVDLAMSAYRRELLEGRNRIPLSAGAHTLDFYRSLPEGWSPAPPGLPTDLHMWMKFLRHPDCRFRAGEMPTVLVFPAAERGPGMAARLKELEGFMERTRDDRGMAEIDRQVARQKIREAAVLEGYLLEAAQRGTVFGPTCELQVFFPTCDGYSERDSRRLTVRVDTWQTLAVTLPVCDSDLPVRIDPCAVPGLVEIGEIRLSGPDGSVLWRLTQDNAPELLVGSTAVAISLGDPVRILSDGDDPQVFLPRVAALRGKEGVELTLTVRVAANLRAVAESLGAVLRGRFDGVHTSVDAARRSACATLGGAADEEEGLVVGGGCGAAELGGVAHDGAGEGFGGGSEMGAEGFGQAAFAELDAGGVAGFGDAVGVEHERIARAQADVGDRVGDLAE
jgi:hypothetical protein